MASALLYKDIQGSTEVWYETDRDDLPIRLETYQEECSDIHVIKAKEFLRENGHERVVDLIENYLPGKCMILRSVPY